MLGWVVGAVVVGAVVFLVALLRSDADWATLRATRAMASGSGFKGQLVWVTGASSGIGAAFAVEVAQHGAIVVLSARRRDKLQQVAERCRAAGAAAVHVVELDLTDMDSHADVTARVEALAPYGIDVLVNNAGRGQRSLVEETSIDVDRAIFETNVFGTMSLTKAVLPAMLKRGSGRILVTSSVAGKVPTPCGATYSASKHAVNGFFRSLATEVCDRGVSVTVACPGPTESEGQSKALRGDGTPVGNAGDKSKRLTAERCARLMAGAAHAGLAECWISPHPVLLFVYIAQYVPSLGVLLGNIVGPKRVQA